MTKFVTKRDGTLEPLDINKFNRVATFACEGLSGVSVSELQIRTQIQFHDNIQTKDIQETLINAAHNLISEHNPNYQYVAGRLINYQIRKQVYGQYEPATLYPHYEKVRDRGYYDWELGLKYSQEEWAVLNAYIDHSRDDSLAYAAMEQFRGKYLIRDRTTGQFQETPQISMMLIAMCFFQNYKEDRLKWVKDMYDALSNFDISLPTPIMAGLRSPDRQFSSCVLIESADDLDSINATTSATVKYVSQRAGIGLSAPLRGIKSPIRGGRVTSTGILPFIKLMAAAVSSCSQGSVRAGKATLNLLGWHQEIEDLLVLKNSKGNEENRERSLDYCIHFNRLMYQRLLDDSVITLFSPSEVPGLYEAFYADQEEFERLYEKYEVDPSIRKKQVSALELFSTFMSERKETGRIYLMNVDHCNDHGSFLPEYAAVRMTNLCTEITLPTNPIYNILDGNPNYAKFKPGSRDGEIALCTLAAVNWGRIKHPDDFEKPCTLLVRALNELLDYQGYPVPAAEKATKARRPLGIGIINFAYWMVKNGNSYNNPNMDQIHEYMEAWSYYLIKASVDMAEERGSCPLSHHTKYSQGIMPIHTYKKDVDELVAPVYRKDWETLSQRAQTFGILNSTLMAIAPTETSSQVSNATAAIDPIRALVTVKKSKDGVLKQVAPGIHKYKNKYEPLWDVDPLQYIYICAVIQKFVDQAISVNNSYDTTKHEDGELSLLMLIEHLTIHYKYGGKTLYYLNSNDGAGEIESDDDCASCKI